MPDVTFYCDLPPNEIRETQDPFLIAELKEYKEELDVQFEAVVECLQKYPEIFESKSLERQNFLAIYAQVCSRCFGWGLPHTSMIPMADNMNHSDTNVIFEMITRSVHVKADIDSSYFSRSKFMNDYQAIFERD